jgi:hypothetical protein
MIWRPSSTGFASLPPDAQTPDETQVLSMMPPRTAGFDRRSSAAANDSLVWVAFALTTLTMALAAIVMVVSRRISPPTELPNGAPFYSSYHLSAFLTALVPPYNSRPQKLAHGAILFTIVCVWGVSLLRPRAMQLLGDRSRPNAASRLTVVALGALLALDLLPRWWPEALPLGRTLFLSLLLGASLFALVHLSARHRSWSDRLALLFIVASLLAASLPGLWRPIDISARDMKDVSIIQAHYSLVLGTGHLLAHGRHLLTEARPYYGLIFPLITAALARAGHLVSIRDWFQLVRISQVLYLLLAVVCLYRVSRGRWIDCLLPFILIFPWYHFDHLSVLFPNQAGIRLLGLAVATLMATFAIEADGLVRASMILGLGSGFACLANVETGIPTLAGAAAALWVKSSGATSTVRLRRWSGALLVVLSGLVLTVGIWLVSIRILLGYWLADFGAALHRYLSTILLFGQMNLGGMALTRDLWPLVMLAHAIFVLLCLFARPSDSSPRAAMRGYAAASLAVWFSYYANRPHEWNTSGFYLLYGVLAVDLCRTLRVAFLARRQAFGVSLAVVVCGLGIIPRAVRIVETSGLRSALRVSTPTGKEVGGIYLAPPIATDLAERAAFIAQRGGSSTDYLSSDSFFVPVLSRSISAIPFLDAANEVYVEHDYNHLLTSLRTEGASEIYLDAPGTIARRDGVFHKFYDYLGQSLSAWYSPESTTHGWVVLRRKPVVPARAP